MCIKKFDAEKIFLTNWQRFWHSQLGQLLRENNNLILHSVWNQLLLELPLDLFNTLQIFTSVNLFAFKIAGGGGYQVSHSYCQVSLSSTKVINVWKLSVPIHRQLMSHLMTKPTKWHVRPVKSQISFASWSESLLCAQWVAKGPSFLHATAETLIRLGGCPGWSESSLVIHAILLVLTRGGSNHDWIPLADVQASYTLMICRSLTGIFVSFLHVFA